MNPVQPLRPRPTRAGALLALALLAAALPASAADPESGWFKLLTPNFEMFSNARESEGRRLLRELETFRHVVSRFVGLTHVQRRPARVYFFRDDATFRPFKPLYAGQPRPVSGFHAEDPLDYTLALSRQARGTITMRVVFHEYTHLLTAREFRHAPVWAHEGLAEVFSTFESDGDRFDIGIALTNHVHYLQRHPPGPLLSILNTTRDSRDYNEELRAGRFYATSWLLTHYLLFAREGFRSNVLSRYAALCAQTTNHLDAFHVAFGQTPDQLQPQLADYLRGGRYTVVRQTWPDLEPTRPRRERLQSGELDFALGRLLQSVNRPQDARTRLERAAQSAPDNPRPREALALLSWTERDRDGIQHWAGEALRRESQDPFTHYLAAEVAYQRTALEPLPASTRANLLTEGRRLCERALELDPLLAPAHHLLGVYVLAAHPGAPALAAVHVREALRCDPQYRPAALTWASLLAAQGRFQDARRVLAALLAGPLPQPLRDKALEVAAEIDRRLARPN